MDFIILNSDGSLQKQSLTRYIQQGSHGVDEIFIGWVNATSSQTLQAVFTLPNQLTNTELGTFESNYEYEPGETMSGWVITLTENQTRYNGALMVSARVILNGIVQVAYPFALIINETGVRPDTDSGVTIAQLDSYLLNIQNLVTDAVRQNTDATLSNTSENPVQNKVVTNAIDTLKRGSYTKVNTTEYPTLQDFLNTEGEEGYLYLYPVNTSNEDEGYYQYIWENNLWIPLGTTKIDIANMVTTDTEQTITGTKKFSFSPLPTADDAYDLGLSSYTWKDLHLSGKINAYDVDHPSTNYWYIFAGNEFNLIVAKNGKNRYLFQDKQFSPADYQNPQCNLGSANYSWKDLYLSGVISDGSNSVAVADIAKKVDTTGNYDVGAFDSNGEITVDIGTFEQDIELLGWGQTLHGMYMLTYSYAQAIVYLDKDQLDTAGNNGIPIRTAMPVVYNATGSAEPGNLRVQKVGTNYVFKVSNGVHNAYAGLHLIMIKTDLVK